MIENNLTNSITATILEHAKETIDKEICGLIVVFKGREKYVRCRNISETDSSDHFVIHPEDYAAAEDFGTITTVVHSHPRTNPKPSEADLVGIEKSGLPWLIVNPRTEQHTITKPTGYKAPLVGRPFVHGILDCYAIIKDYFKENLSIEMPEYFRQDDWWHNGQSLYRDNFEKAGFREVPMTALKVHDCFIICNGATEPNHAAVYIEEGKILHHVQGRLSSIDVFGGFWLKNTWKVVRHKDL